MIARNMKELEKILNQQLQKAMCQASNKMLGDMYEETEGFYKGTQPKVYERTGALGDTPKTTSLNINNNEVSFVAYLDTSHKYTTGDNPTMMQVLKLANSGEPWKTKNGSMALPTVGQGGFWERAEAKMKKSFQQTLEKYFE